MEGKNEDGFFNNPRIFGSGADIMRMEPNGTFLV